MCGFGVWHFIVFVVITLIYLKTYINTFITWFSSNMVSACIYYARQFMERLLKIQIFMNFYSICLLSVHFSSSVFTKPSSPRWSCLKTRFCTNTFCNMINLQNFKVVCFINVHFLLYENCLIHKENSENIIISISSLWTQMWLTTHRICVTDANTKVHSSILITFVDKLSWHFPFLRCFHDCSTIQFWLNFSSLWQEIFSSKHFFLW